MTDNRKTIAWICSNYTGVGPPMTPLMLSLDQSKYRIIVIYLKKKTDSPNPLDEKGIKSYYISRKKYFRLFDLLTVWKFSRILKAEKVDILHGHRHQSSVYGAVAGKIAGTPLVFAHVHGLNRSKKLRRKLINRLVFRWVTKIITAGNAVKEDVLKNNPTVKPEQVVCLNNSIDYKRFAEISAIAQQVKKDIGLKPDSFVFGTVGRFAPTKGYTYLIDAFAKVKRHVPNAHLIFVGRGRQENEIRAQAQQAGIYDSVTFLGRRDDIPQVLRAFDVFVFPSIAEGMPYAVLEAMAARLPVVASAVGGIPDILDNGELGMLIPPKDKNALAEAMINSVKKPKPNSSQITETAKQKISEKHSHEVIIKSLDNIYETEYKAAKENN